MRNIWDMFPVAALHNNITQPATWPRVHLIPPSVTVSFLIQFYFEGIELHNSIWLLRTNKQKHSVSLLTAWSWSIFPPVTSLFASSAWHSQSPELGCGWELGGNITTFLFFITSFSCSWHLGCCGCCGAFVTIIVWDLCITKDFDDKIISLNPSHKIHE